MVKNLVIIQARNSSQRLKFKTLFPLNNFPLISFLYRNVYSKNYRIIVATSKDKSDDILCELLKNQKIEFYRGSLNDVHSRYMLLCKKNIKYENIIRLTADNPLVNSTMLKDLIKEFNKSSYKFMFIDPKVSKLPYGIAVEVFKNSFFRSIKATNAREKEHVTLKFRKKKNKKYMSQFSYNINNDYSKLRATIDTIDDYKILNNIFSSNIKFPINLKKTLNKLERNILKKDQKFNLNNDFQKKFVLGTAQLCNNYGILKKNIDHLNLKKNGIKILENCRKFNVKFLDTAHSYKNTEKLIGNFQKKNQYHFSVYSKLKHISNKLPIKNIIKEIDNSVKDTLKRLKVKKIFCIQIHQVSNLYDHNGIFIKQLYKLKKKNIIKKIGVSVYEREDFMHALKNKYISVIQFPINVIDFRWNNINKIVKKFGKKKEFIARSIFLQGRLIQKYKNNTLLIKKINKFKEISKRLSSKDLLINYVKTFKWISKIIIGIDDYQQLNELYFLFNRDKLKKSEMDFIKGKNRLTSEKFLQPNKWK